MSTIQEEASGKKSGEIRYLTPLDIDNSTVKKYCRFKKYGIKYVDYKDSDFLLKFINEQGKLRNGINFINLYKLISESLKNKTSESEINFTYGNVYGT